MAAISVSDRYYLNDRTYNGEKHADDNGIIVLIGVSMLLSRRILGKTNPAQHFPSMSCPNPQNSCSNGERGQYAS